MDPLIRFAARVSVPADIEACWEWTGAQTEKGYGRFWDGKRITRVHRFAFELYVGKIDAGQTVDHLCRNRRCVNPLHLRQCSSRENTLAHGSLSTSALNALKTHCKHGHPFDKSNTLPYRNGRSRACRVCCAENSKRYYRSIRQSTLQARGART